MYREVVTIVTGVGVCLLFATFFHEELPPIGVGFPRPG
jgi:hypothetical protein